MIRLDKMLAHMLYGSRKEVKKMIRDGLVYVNGIQVFDDDLKVDEVNDEINILNQNIEYKEFVYFMLNKPIGYVSATFDYNNPTVIDLIDKKYEGIFPVGRLDIDSTGLLLITNDGKLAHELLSPKKHVFKKYYIEFDGKYNESFVNKFKEGITLDDGYKCKEAFFEYLGDNRAYVTISEGKYHQVKRMMETLNCKVTSLNRVSFGPLDLDYNLKLGESRELTKEEIKLLGNAL